MNLKKTIKTMMLASVAFVSLPAVGQDLMANQAPIDRRLRSVDSIALQRLIEKEQFIDEPSEDLYSGWNTESVHCYGDASTPSTYKIDLRGFCMPTTSRVVTSNYGYRSSFRRMHKGIDVKVYIGDTIRAAFNGKIRIVKYEARGYGNYVVIRHPNGLETIYGHMSKQLVRENQNVRAGDPIGLGGNTGRSTGSHLHFETRLLGQAINPALLFDFRNQDVTGNFYTYRKNSYSRESVLANLETYSNNSNVSRSVEKAANVRSNRERPKAAAAAVKYHKIARGETLSSIASKRGLSVERLCRLNRITKRTKIQAGQILRYSK